MHHLLLRELVRDGDWVIGAVNYDEDLHFSTYYLRASLASQIDDHPGYTFIVGLYEDFTERYYVLRDECVATAASIVQRALEESGWLSSVLTEITKRSDAVVDALPEALSPAMLRDCDASDLLALYRAHHRAHSDLYRVARIPEALDRGVSWYSRYLKQFLSEAGVASDDTDATFAVLTQPTTVSVLSEEIAEFDAICETAQHRNGLADVMRYAPRRTRLLLPADILQALRVHWIKWRYLSYHGYGRREPAAFAEHVDRLVQAITDGERITLTFEQIQRKLYENRDAREEMFDGLRIDAPHRALFSTYSEIGAAKLYRRYAQLRNFYRLDMLLAEIAVRLGHEEWAVRCARPEEVDAALEANEPLAPAVLRRRTGCAYVIANGREDVLTGEIVRELKTSFELKTKATRDRKVLKGVVASRGSVVGTCKLMVRADHESERAAKGAVIVSEATDPDLLRFLQIAGAVLTEQGGVTSHAALICRELGIPAIIGIEGLLDAVQDGDVVEVDAHTGVVTLLDRNKTRPPAGVLVEDAAIAAHDEIGAKAASLLRARARGLRIPDTVVLRFAALRHLVGSADGEGLHALARWLAYRLDFDRGVAIRSSAVQEDSSTASMAGAFASLINVREDELQDKLRWFVEANEERARPAQYHGGVILQPMIAGGGGVCLTQADSFGHANALTIEVATGGAAQVTAGEGEISRLVVAREGGDILLDNRATAAPDVAGVPIADLVTTFLNIERQFGFTADIEWGVDAGKLVVLQVRRIANPTRTTGAP